MAKKQTASKNKRPLSRYGAMVITATAIAVFFVITIAQMLYNYNMEAEYNRATAMRQIITRSLEALKVDAAVDPKTGDTYFPEAKLYLPYDSKATRLTYDYNDVDNILSVSSKSIVWQSRIGFDNAMNTTQLFEKLPYVQACQRGVDVLYTQQHPDAEGKVLKQTVKLSNGKTLYVFSEKACPLLDDLTTSLKNIRAYSL